MAKKTGVTDESATTQVNIADFQRTRDSVIVALATLQSSVQELSRAYINHANTVLVSGRGGELNSNLTNILSESGLLTGSATAVTPQLQLQLDDTVGPDGKKKKRKRAHDPDAPKRALTPYFLYMQSARTQIAKELGDHAKPKEVADEGTRRWGMMTAAEKSVWDLHYQKNLAVYRVRMAAYKAKQPVPDEATAAKLVAQGKAPDFVPEEQAEAEPEESSPEPVAEPEPPKKKRKSEKVVETPAKETPKAAAKSGEKKSKKTKKEEEPVAAPEPASTSKAEKKKRSKK